ncbi:hypothetical protein BC828DRAFT_394471 [Blastocladiella britannica]|nr:hypothetical protein BC828DRAFT_394471 [Blastocladiella britannica]
MPPNAIANTNDENEDCLPAHAPRPRLPAMVKRFWRRLTGHHRRRKQHPEPATPTTPVRLTYAVYESGPLFQPTPVPVLTATPPMSPAPIISPARILALRPAPSSPSSPSSSLSRRTRLPLESHTGAGAAVAEAEVELDLQEVQVLGQAQSDALLQQQQQQPASASQSHSRHHHHPNLHHINHHHSRRRRRGSSSASSSSSSLHTSSLPLATTATTSTSEEDPSTALPPTDSGVPLSSLSCLVPLPASPPSSPPVPSPANFGSLGRRRSLPPIPNPLSSSSLATSSTTSLGHPVVDQVAAQVAAQVHKVLSDCEAQLRTRTAVVWPPPPPPPPSSFPLTSVAASPALGCLGRGVAPLTTTVVEPEVEETSPQSTPPSILRHPRPQSVPVLASILAVAEHNNHRRSVTIDPLPPRIGHAPRYDRSPDPEVLAERLRCGRVSPAEHRRVLSEVMAIKQAARAAYALTLSASSSPLQSSSATVPTIIPAHHRPASTLSVSSSLTSVSLNSSARLVGGAVALDAAALVYTN